MVKVTREPIQRQVKRRDVCEICAGHVELIAFSNRKYGGYVHTICRNCLKDICNFKAVTIQDNNEEK